MILSVTPNPCVDKTLEVPELRVGEKHRQVTLGCVAGGKGNNVARCVRTLGHDAAALVIAGGHTGRHVVEMLEQDDGVRCIPFWTQQPTRTITTIHEKRLGRQTALFEPGPQLSESEAAAFISLFEQSLDGVRMVTLNGAVPCDTLKHAYADMTRIARTKNIPVLLDAYGDEFVTALEEFPWCVKINRDEASAWLDHDMTTEEECLHALNALHFKGVDVAILSHGAKDIYARWGDECFRVTPPKVKEINPVGSGDVFTGALCVAVLDGYSPQDALAFAAATGAANAQCWDIGHFKVDEVERLRAEVKIEVLSPLHRPGGEG